MGVMGRGLITRGVGLTMGRGSLYDPVLANAGAAANVSTAGGTYAAFLTNSLRDLLSLLIVSVFLLPKSNPAATPF